MNTNTQNASTGSRAFRSDLFCVERLKVEPGGERIPSEHEEQRAFVEVWRKAGLPRIFAIPNGEARGIRAATRLKAEGVSKGVPDLYCPEWRLWIEFKRRKGGSVSQDQKDWHEYLQECGDTVIIPKGAHQAVGMVIDFMESNKGSF